MSIGKQPMTHDYAGNLPQISSKTASVRNEHAKQSSALEQLGEDLLIGRLHISLLLRDNAGIETLFD